MTISLKRGQTMIVHLLDHDNIRPNVTSIEGHIRATKRRGVGVDPAGAVVASIVWTEREATESMVQGWTGTVAAGITADIPEGDYAWDAMLTLDSGVVVSTQTVEFELREPATVVE